MDKSNWSLILRDQKCREERRRGKERRRGRGREEEEKRRRKEEQKRYETMTMCMELCIVCMDTCLWVVGCKKPNPRINSCMDSNIKYGNYEILYEIMCIWTMVGISIVFKPRV